MKKCFSLNFLEYKTLMKNLLNQIKNISFQEPGGVDEIKQTLANWQERKLIDSGQCEMIMSILKFSRLQVRDVMINRSQMVTLVQDSKVNVIKSLNNGYKHSRYPVWKSEAKDEIVGLMLVKDILNQDDSNIEISKLMRKPVFVPESQRLDTLLRSFKLSHVHMAIVVDEFGGVSGLITIEDVLEQIVGDIEDEHDANNDREPISVIEGRTYIRGLLPIKEFNNHFSVKLDDGYFDTISGIIARQFGKIPINGEKIIYGGFEFTVIQADQRRINLMEVKPVS
ncbi:MAG: CBS domain-containing protein [Gammaproteobacteria bacterium]|nr:CBS domain-containing protein [Gammaproteobacteria bacterium]